MYLVDAPFPDLKSHLSWAWTKTPCFGWSIVGRKIVALQLLVIQEGSVLSDVELVNSAEVGL